MMANRQYYLDNLKVFLTVLVIFHHAGQAYGNGGAWAYTPSNPAEFIPWIWHFFSTNASFFMGLYFLISGYFVPKSYDKHGGKKFVRKSFIKELLTKGFVWPSCERRPASGRRGSRCTRGGRAEGVLTR